MKYSLNLKKMLPRGSALGLLGVMLLSTSCTYLRTSPNKVTEELKAASLSIDVFSARGFLGGSEYERYALHEDVLWRECGTVNKQKAKTTDTSAALEGNEVLKSDPNLSIEERRVENINTRQVEALKQFAAELLASSKDSSRLNPAPGSFFSLSDPGLFEMTIRLGEVQRTWLTSVDAVADKQTPALERAHELFAALRGIGPTICEAPTFFGISRLSID